MTDVVHVLHEGFPLCRFSTKVPADWPEGHKWVRLEEYRDATCPNCRTMAIMRLFEERMTRRGGGGRYYVLDAHRQARPATLIEWAEYQSGDEWERRHVVGRDKATGVSTVFLGIDHNHWGEGPPLLFETMVFGGPLAGECERCSTWAEAEAQHAQMVARVREAMKRTN